ncbi:MAG: FkbM family methyltransferase [Flavobacteriaceae bacterium]|nr:FkbM family methyltransferase [Flavobacteriaceae bacterium]
MINPYSALAQHFSFISPTIYKSRFYKKLIQLNKNNIFERNIEPELLWLKDFLPQKAIFFDIGAGNGDYIYFLDYLLFPENIYAFEPNKKLCKRLKNLFSKINFFPIALSDENLSGILSFPIIDKEEFPEKSTLNPISADEDTKVFTQKVEVCKLDDWANKREFLRLDFIKIDVVGHELKVLEGAKETIQKFEPTLMVKIEQKHYEQDIWEVIKEIEKLDYSAHYLCRENFILKPLQANILEEKNKDLNEENSRYIKNFIFIKNSK